MPNLQPDAPARITAATLNAALLASDSATEVLERLCGKAVTVRHLAPNEPAPTPTVLHAAGIILHRHVALCCGCLVLSHADLWFVPARLPDGMVRTLAETDLPFGNVVRGLGLRRHTLRALELPPGSAVALEHRAMLTAPSGQPIAEVWERYCWGLVAPA